MNKVGKFIFLIEMLTNKLSFLILLLLQKTFSMLSSLLRCSRSMVEHFSYAENCLTGSTDCSALFSIAETYLKMHSCSSNVFNIYMHVCLKSSLWHTLKSLFPE